MRSGIGAAAAAAAASPASRLRLYNPSHKLSTFLFQPKGVSTESVAAASVAALAAANWPVSRATKTAIAGGGSASRTAPVAVSAAVSASGSAASLHSPSYPLYSFSTFTLVDAGPCAAAAAASQSLSAASQPLFSLAPAARVHPAAVTYNNGRLYCRFCCSASVVATMLHQQHLSNEQHWQQVEKQQQQQKSNHQMKQRKILFHEEQLQQFLERQGQRWNDVGYRHSHPQQRRHFTGQQHLRKLQRQEEEAKRASWDCNVKAQQQQEQRQEKESEQHISQTPRVEHRQPQPQQELRSDLQFFLFAQQRFMHSFAARAAAAAARAAAAEGRKPVEAAAEEQQTVRGEKGKEIVERETAAAAEREIQEKDTAATAAQPAVGEEGKADAHSERLSAVCSSSSDWQKSNGAATRRSSSSRSMRLGGTSSGDSSWSSTSSSTNSENASSSSRGGRSSSNLMNGNINAILSSDTNASNLQQGRRYNTTGSAAFPEDPRNSVSSCFWPQQHAAAMLHAPAAAATYGIPTSTTSSSFPRFSFPARLMSACCSAAASPSLSSRKSLFCLPPPPRPNFFFSCTSPPVVFLSTSRAVAVPCITNSSAIAPHSFAAVAPLAFSVPAAAAAGASAAFIRASAASAVYRDAIACELKDGCGRRYFSTRNISGRLFYKRRPLQVPRLKPPNLRSKWLEGAPQKKGICVKVKVQTPRKPNSGLRKVARVRLSTGRTVLVYIPGIGHNLNVHSVVLVRGGRCKDVPGCNYKAVRGACDLLPVKNRERKRSKYAVKLSPEKKNWRLQRSSNKHLTIEEDRNYFNTYMWMTWKDGGTPSSAAAGEGVMRVSPLSEDEEVPPNPRLFNRWYRLKCQREGRKKGGV